MRTSSRKLESNFATISSLDRAADRFCSKTHPAIRWSCSSPRVPLSRSAAIFRPRLLKYNARRQRPGRVTVESNCQPRTNAQPRSAALRSQPAPAKLHTKCITAERPLAPYRRKGDLRERRLQSRWLLSRLIPHRHRPRAELQPTHELQVDMLR